VASWLVLVGFCCWRRCSRVLLLVSHNSDIMHLRSAIKSNQMYLIQTTKIRKINKITIKVITVTLKYKIVKKEMKSTELTNSKQSNVIDS